MEAATKHSRFHFVLPNMRQGAERGRLRRNKTTYSRAHIHRCTVFIQPMIRCL
ncbi:MAG: hypothetical protein LBV68_06465 [Spirochaetaceae bacterium]|nr:hypothetical protein [Spirochaetaceae bacterium]